MEAQLRKFELSLRGLVQEINPEEDSNMYRKVIDVLRDEIRRLSRNIPAHPSDYPSSTPNRTASAQRSPQRIPSCTSMDQLEPAHNKPSAGVASLETPQQAIPSSEFTNDVEQELQDVARVMMEASRIIVLAGAGISTNCGIPDFRSETGLHKTNRGLFEREVLDDERRRKDLYNCLVKIRSRAKSENLVLTDMHRFLHVLRELGKLQRCYTQNLDGLEARAGLNVDIDSINCDAVQLHGNLDSFRCSYCRHLTNWDRISETALMSGEIVPCAECTRRVEERRRRGGRTNIHVGYLRPNIVLFQDVDDPLSERKASIIDKDAKSKPEVLLIVGTSLAIDGPRYELKNKLIPAVHRNGGKVIYVNNKPPPKMFSRPVVDYIFEMDCDLWVRGLTAREPSLLGDGARQGSYHLSCGFYFQPKAKTVEEVIKEAELQLVSVGDYSDVQSGLRTREEVREDLAPFIPSNWPSTSPLMCILSLFRWDESTKVLHSQQMEYSGHAVPEEMRNGLVWPIGQKHTRIIIPHNPGNHWILIVVDIPTRTITYYSSLPGYELGDCYNSVVIQMKRVGERLGLDYSTWNPLIEGSSHRQTNGSDCGIYLLENARRLSLGEVINGAPIKTDSLRVFYAELLLARSLHEASERSLLKSVLYPESSRSWQVGAVPRSYAFDLDSTRVKRRKLQIEEVDAQNVSTDESDSDWDEGGTRPRDLTAIRADISTLFNSDPLRPWEKYLERFANCRLQRSKTPLGYPRAFRLLQMVASIACPEHFVALKGAIARYRVLAPEEVIQTPLDLSNHLYTVGIWTERLGLINIILQRFVRAYFTSLINEGTNLFQDQSGCSVIRKGCAIAKSIKAMVVKIYPRMSGWDSSVNPAERSAFSEVQCNLRRWRQEGAIWSLVQNRFSSLALLALVPNHIRIQPTSQSVSGSSFQTEIPRNARALFVEALAELRPHIWSYIPKLGHLFDIFSNPTKLRTRQFQIELATDDEIRNAMSGSTLLVNAFDYADEGNDLNSRLLQ